MARKKKSNYNPLQYTLTFDVIANHIEKIQSENAKEDREDTVNVKQAVKSSGNSPKRTEVHNNVRHTHSGVQQGSLFDIGQMGAEPTGRPAPTGSTGGNSLHVSPDTSDEFGDESFGERSGGRSPEAGDERLGNFREPRDRHQPQDFRITPDIQLGYGGAKTKYADNIAAIKLVQELQARNVTVATHDEQKILVRYVGWGGIPQVFDPQNEKWAQEYQELKALLAPEAYANARRSTQDAHFTSETVINGIYQGLERLGVQQDAPLRILEPSAGIGNFLGLMPHEKTKILAVEQDTVTSAIAKYLYPTAHHLNTGFQYVDLKKDSFDLVVGNPPFGSQSLYDASAPELRGMSIHNYFLSKSLKSLRTGGIGAFVVSRYFMDAQDSSVREYISQYADLLGAIRLPDMAFQQNALTQVTTDLVFFQRHEGIPTKPVDWVRTNLVTLPDTKHGGERVGAINNYFVQHPEQIIGTLTFAGGMHENDLRCIATNMQDLGQEISERLVVLPTAQFVPRAIDEEKAVEPEKNIDFIASDYFQSLKMGAFCFEPKSRKVVFKVSGAYGEPSYDEAPVKNDIAKQRLIGLISVRDSLRGLLTAEKNDAEPQKIEELRQTLNTQYDRFVRTFGHINSQTNRSVMREDPEYSLLASLELDYDKGVSKELAKKHGVPPRRPTAKKAAIFTQRVLKPAIVCESADTVQDALLITLREKGQVVMPRIAELLGRPEEDVRKELQHEGLIFLNPRSLEWEIRDKYLTGNVYRKLNEAIEAAKEAPQFAQNVEALRAAMPPEIEAVDIGVKFGSTWLPPDVISDFVNEVIHQGNGHQRIDYIPLLGRWDAKVTIYDRTSECDVWGIPEYPASKLIESLLTNRPIKVEKETGRDHNGKPIMTIDQELTAAAMQKADGIKRAFLDWVWTDDARRASLTKIYNERFNTHVPPSYDGSHIQLVGASSDISLRPHQKDAVWRGIQAGTALFDHVVGAGKTLACIATIMESKRMGFIAKPMVVVPNHLLYQWKDEFYKLYPNANILVADKDDFTKQNRERLFSRIATGEWDAVIVAHSSFKKIDMPREMQETILKEQIDAVISAIETGKANHGSRATIKQLEKQREKMETRYNTLLAANGAKDQAVDFSDLGVDALFVDESHEFKNLHYSTTMNVSGLGNIAGSGKALDMYIKCRYLQKKHDGRGVYFMTGTPISNTIAEVYTLQRYLQGEELRDKGLEYFDAWASTFGQITDGWELDATGVNYKLKSRFASFQNVPELLSMYRSFADVVTRQDLEKQSCKDGGRPLTPPLKGGKPINHVVERSTEQAKFMESIVNRMENLPRDPRIDNPLKVTNDARKAGLDYRLIDPDAKDVGTSKCAAAADRIYTIWNETKDVRGTQLVFCDLSTPKSSARSKTQPAPRGSNAFDFAADDMNADQPVIDVEAGDAEAKDNDSGEDPTVASDMDACLAANASFSVYDDMRRKLIDKGIPAEEIAYIHDANTDLRKAKLFADMQAGRVRVLLGSTAKMGAGMNVQERLVAAHHLDAPWRPSDLEQRNGRIIRQGNKLYENNPDFAVSIYYYATKQTYDSRMWQTIEYKSAAIEQFRKGDLLQRTIDDVQSEAANAAEMKAAASGNPLILLQVKIASDLRKLEALYAQHQRSQHRMRDRLSYLETAPVRLDKLHAEYKANCKLRDTFTTTVSEKGKECIQLEWHKDGKKYTDKNVDDIKGCIREGIHQITRESGVKAYIGTYRGFEVSMLRTARAVSGDGFRLVLKGVGEQEYQPDNLIYDFEDKFSLSGMFQRLDNFFEKGLEQAFISSERKIKAELAELSTAQSVIGQPFPQKDELDLVRENHSAVMRELKRMQDDSTYVSSWEPSIRQEQKPTEAASQGSTLSLR